MIKQTDASGFMLAQESLKNAAETFAMYGKPEHERCARHYHRMLVRDGEMGADVRHYAQTLARIAIRLREGTV